MPAGSVCLSPAQVFGLESLLGTPTLWPLLMGLTVVPSALQLLLFPFCPESPRYLYIVRNKESKAKESESRSARPCPGVPTACSAPRESTAAMLLQCWGQATPLTGPPWSPRCPLIHALLGRPHQPRWAGVEWA